VSDMQILLTILGIVLLMTFTLLGVLILLRTWGSRYGRIF